MPYFGFKAKHNTLKSAKVELYCALFWIQGKTLDRTYKVRRQLYCALFWIQGKTPYNIQPTIKQLYCALFWIQGKTGLLNGER